MSQIDAQRLIMNATRIAMREYDVSHAGEEIDFVARMHWVNGFVAATIPPEIRRLAV